MIARSVLTLGSDLFKSFVNNFVEISNLCIVKDIQGMTFTMGNGSRRFLEHFQNLLKLNRNIWECFQNPVEHCVRTKLILFRNLLTPMIVYSEPLNQCTRKYGRLEEEKTLTDFSIEGCKHKMRTKTSSLDWSIRIESCDRACSPHWDRPLALSDHRALERCRKINSRSVIVNVWNLTFLTEVECTGRSR